MGLTADDYLSMLANLSPHGIAWPVGEDSNFADLLNALAQSLARVDQRADDLLMELDPRTTTELINDWERICGLPDPCTGQLPTLQQRRMQVVSKLNALGGQSVAYFTQVAALLGYTITITEFKPFMAGISRAGDPLTSGIWPFYWQVNAPLNTAVSFKAGQSTAGEPLQSWGNQALQCIMTQLKPAHTDVIFSYS